MDDKMTDGVAMDAETLFETGSDGFAAISALNRETRWVNALTHPDPNQHCEDVVYAVFSEDASPRFMGLVTTLELARNPDRIFADLIPAQAPESVPVDARLDEVERRFAAADVSAVAVMDGENFIGTVTRASLLRALLGRERGHAMRRADASEGLVSALIAHPALGICMLQGTVFTLVNPRFTKLAGRSAASLLGRLGLADIVAAQDWGGVRGRIEALAGAGASTTFDCQLLRPGMREGVYVRGYACTVASSEGEALMVAMVDVTRERQEEASMRLASLAFNCASEGIIVTDRERRILAINPAFTAITGYEAGDVIGRTPAIMKSGRQDREFYDRMWTAIRETGRWEGDIWNRRKDGEIFPEWLRITAVGEDGRAPSHYIGTFYDITWQKEAERHIEHLSFFDPLTGLANRRQLSLMLERVNAQDPEHETAVLFIDIDRFKEINDGLGHAAGDRVLQTVAQRLTRSVRARHGDRKGDFIGRFGGDEFLIIVHGGAQAADKVARHVIEAMRKPFVLKGHPVLHLSASVGVALYPHDGSDVEDIIRKSDLAMYEAKKEGRNRAVFYRDYLDTEARRSLETKIAFRHALDCRQLRLFYQPQVALDSGRLIGMEALLRWQHPERGLLGPDVFGHLLEEPEYAGPLIDWILNTACEQARAWCETLGRPIRVAVNLSPAQFYDTRLCAAVGGALMTSGLAPECLELEITESSPMGNLAMATRILAQLNGMGVRLALDDFGTGYSSLNYLKRLPIHTLKIDRSFVARLPEDGKDAALIGIVTSLAHDFGLEVVAEGVENELQAAEVLRLGCDHAQGFLYSSPQPAEVLEERLGGFGRAG